MSGIEGRGAQVGVNQPWMPRIDPSRIYSALLPASDPARYMVLTGVPPFVAAPLSEMYQNIRDGRYPEPAHLSANARRLIARLLAPNPAERPSLDHLLQDDFFTKVWGVRGTGRPLYGVSQQS